jgi:nicotinate-nucleotide adenylyltransferase
LSEIKKNIGIFGGTFNPVHFGHLRAALEVAEGFPLDECHLVPAAFPPHKTIDDMVAADARLEMLRMAVSGHPSLKISDVELKRSGPSYTIDTVRHFKAQLPGDAILFLIVGLDAFLELDTWKSYRTLLETVAFIVTSRPSPAQNRNSKKWQILKNYLNKIISDEYVGSGACPVFSHPDFLPIHTFDVTMLDISSSKIRELLRLRHSARYLVPGNVLDFINIRGLYL